MSGQTHYLKANHNTEFPRRVICVDTETWTQRDRVSDTEVLNRLRLGHAVYMRYQNNRGQDKWYEQEFPFTKVDEFHNWLDSIIAREKKVKILMVAHNMSFDFPILGMDRYLRGLDWESPKIFVPKAPFLYYTTHVSQEVNLEVISSTNWYPDSLAKVAKVYGSFKLKSPNWKTSDTKVSDKTLAKYCRQDTLALAAIVKGHIKYIRDNNLGCVKPTLPGQAMQAFKHRFMHTDLLVHHHPKVLGIELDAFRGGRVEICNRRGLHKGLYVLDVNSLYPAVMRRNLFPTRTAQKGLIHLSKIDPKTWREQALIAKCDIDLKLPCVAIRSDDLLVFPIGHIRAMLTSPEINYIYTHPEAGSIVKMGVAARYEQGVVFDTYMDHFIAEKEKAAPDSVERDMAKKFMNSLYGKFGQKFKEPIIYLKGTDLEQTIEEMNETGAMLSVSKEYNYYRVGDEVMRVARRNGAGFEVAENSMPRIPAYVTSYARMLLWDYMSIAGLPEVQYVDTDSLFVTKLGLDRLQDAGLIHPTETGKLKLEKGPINIELLAPKFYRVGRKWKRKGISHKAKRVGDLSWEQQQFKTGMSRYRQGITDAVSVQTVTKTCTLEYNKGVVDAKGNITPFVFKEW